MNIPLGFDLGPFTIRFYGIILVIGAVAGTVLAYFEAKRRDQDPELVWDAMIWALILGIVGARIWHIFTPEPSLVEVGITTRFYLTHPLDALAVWNGGLGIPGGVIGGSLGLWIFARRNKLNFLTWMDIGAPGLALAQAIGRWGNFINQELYGPPTDLPWGIPIDPAYRLPEYMNETHFHPLFLYESLWNLANMGLLLWLSRRYGERLKPGTLMLVYLIVYPVGRFMLEFIRPNSPMTGGVQTNQAIMGAVAVVSGIALFLRLRKNEDVPMGAEGQNE